MPRIESGPSRGHWTLAAVAVGPRIVGGQEAEPGAWPWMASLQVGDFHFCGGTLVDPEWVVTAARCVAGSRPEYLEIVLGRDDLSTDAGQRHAVSEILVHPQYDPASNDADLALLHLASPSPLPPLSLATPDQAALFAPGVAAIVTGWGNLSEGGSAPNVLHQVTVPIVSNELANQSYNGLVTENMLAAGSAEGGIDSCQGDSGGPLMVSDGDEGHLLAGIVSWGFGCARPGYYGIYTRVANFGDWVTAQMAGQRHLSHRITLEFGEVVTGVDFGNRLANAPPTVLDVTINANFSDPGDLPAGSQPTSWSRQRADIREITVRFSEPMIATVGDLRLTNLGVNAPAERDMVINLTARHLTLDDEVLTLRFDPGELPDGVYQLEVLASVEDLQGGRLDGNGDGDGGDAYLLEGNQANRFYQMTGDWNGDGGVTFFDFSALSYWFGYGVSTAPSYLDLNNDGSVSIHDFAEFAGHYGEGIVYPTTAPTGGKHGSPICACQGKGESYSPRTSGPEARFLLLQSAENNCDSGEFRR